MNYIDTHSHLHFAQFDSDRADVHARMRDAGVTTIAIGTSLQTSTDAVALAQNNPDIVRGATIGVHPTDYNEEFVPYYYERFLDSGVVVGVGECGLDYFRTPRSEVYERQRALFEAQIQFALEHDLPLMLHVRPSKGSDDAHDDALAILQQYAHTHGAALRGTAHFFTGSLASAQKYWDLGFCTSFPGVITFAPETEVVVREVPLDRILTETDAPYAAPVPYRGSRCEPTHVVEVVKKIAEIKNVSPETIIEHVRQNTQRVFRC
jgi:TatD DNase family protein